ncbi:titin-like isoform X2 [Plodia interpunctella]|nr:titin-like isoform X2 [Plodia interpunctella]XP_053623320.1 titin-like isoform X2 [Plodia interpunctella]
MEAPVYKIQYEFITPTNIESEVPGKQDIREGGEQIAAEISTVAPDNKTENPDDYVLSPVITVTKQEAEYTKGDLKLQKVSVTEDISEHIGAVYYTINSNPSIKSEVIKAQPVRVIEDERKTRIPTLKNRTPAEGRRASVDKNEPPPPRLNQKRSSIPRLRDSRIPPPLDRRASKPDIKLETPQPEDEFEKIYGEIVSEPNDVIDVIESVKVEDPEKLDNTFEEIIHDYEENKVQPITIGTSVNVNKPKSKIPLSKRKSEQEIKIAKPAERVVKKDEPKAEKNEMRVPVHKHFPQKAVRTKYNIKNDDKANDVEKIEINKPTVIENSKTDNVKHKQLMDPVKVAAIELIEPEMRENVIQVDKKSIINTVKEIGENINNVELDNVIQTEPEAILDNVKEPELTIKPISQENVVMKPFITESTECTNELTPIEIAIEKNQTNGIPVIDSNIESKDDKENMDTEYKPGKVSRLLHRIRSQEFGTDNLTPKKEVLIDVPKKKSVLSKIAMFERQDEPRPRVKLPIIKPKEIKPETMKEEHIDRKPIIVDELLKESNLDSIGYDTSIDYLPIEHLDTKKGYTVEIQDDKVQYHEIEDNNEEESTANIENSNLNNVMIFDKPTEFSQRDEIESITLKNKIIASTSRVGIVNQNSIEFLEPPAENLNENVPREIVVETVGHTSAEYDITPISNDENSDKVEEKDSDTFKYEPNTTDYKVDIPIENRTVQESKIETLEFEPISFDGKVENDVFSQGSKVEQWKSMNENKDITKERLKSVADVDLGDAVKGKVHQIIVRMNSVEKIENNKKEINPRERPRKKSVSKIIALFEQKSYQIEQPASHRPEVTTRTTQPPATLTEEEYQLRTAELASGKLVYGRMENMAYIVLNNGLEMPVLAVGTALLDNRLVRPVIEAAIDMGYRAIDTAYIYGNEKEVGEAIKTKIDDGTVKREDLFIISKLWSTFHRSDLVHTACSESLKAIGLTYFDLYLIHNPVSFKEGPDPIPKIANVVQYSSSDFMDAWYGMETLVTKGLVKSIGLSNFNSKQLQRILDKGRVKPVINQVECHPYLSQRPLAGFCSAREVKLSCFGVLGSKGTPKEYTSGLPAVIDDPLVQAMADGLNITAAQLLIRYQIDSGHSVVVKASSPAHLWDNLQALKVALDPTQVKALQALNRNKRIFTFAGIGDTHRNYPFRIPY